MKKILFLFGFIFLTFFSFNTNVHANVHTGISYDSNEHFNIFYEIKENTPMANTLLSNNYNSLCSLWGLNCTNNNYRFYIAYSSDFEKIFKTTNISIPENSKYVVFYPHNPGKVTRNGITYFHQIGSVNTHIPYIYLDSKGERIDFSSYGTVDYNYNDLLNQLFTYDFNNTSKEDIENFTYFISALWYCSSGPTLYGMFEKTYVTDVIYDDERLLIDDSEVNSNIFTKIKNTWLDLFNSDSLIDAKQLNLDFFQKNPYMTDTQKPSSMFTILNYSNSVVPPYGFKPLNFKYEDISVSGYLFIPKNINNQTNRNLYGYTTDLPRKSFANENIASVKQGVSGFSLNSNNSISALAEKNADYHINYKENYQLYDLDYQTKLANKYPDYKTTTTAIWVSHAIKYDSVLYYNPNAFNVCPLYTTGTTTNDTGDTILTYNSCTFTNPVTNEEVTLSGDDFYNTISSTNTVGASPNIGITGDGLDEYNKYNELWETDESGNLTGFSITSVLKQLHSFLTSFIAVITTIFASFTLFFNALPLEIRGLLYFSLIGGVILLFWKLIH